MPLKIVRDNIVHIQADAIVNAANDRLLPGGGVCGSIFDVAGYDQMRAACEAIGGCETGKAVITPGFRLPARYVIHTVGPVWQGGGQGEEQLLRACYRSAMALAVERGLQSVAFPLLASGIYGYPKDQALQVAISEISAFLLENELDVILVVYDAQSFRLSWKLFAGIAAYIDDQYVQARIDRAHLRARPGVLTGECAQRIARQADVYAAYDAKAEPAPTLEDAIDSRMGPFTPTLLALIDAGGMTDVAVYKRANIDRKLFSKIRSNPGYRPSKPTAVALAVALRLSLPQTQDLLSRAGYTLSRAQKADIIVEYFISRGNYNIHEINEALFAFDQPLLGA
ncbi:MAG TPA: macro domain-containing protein [Candidatus Limiplasma sp.]|nr:macro domain-containing protein [Candidatus Limiplasma sp.]